MPNSNFIFRAFNNIINNTTHSFIVALDINYNFLVSNDAHKQMFRDLFGKEVEIGTNMLNLLAGQPEALQKQQQVWKKALSGEEFMILESHVAQDNTLRYYEVSYSPILDKQAHLIGATAITRDVTDKTMKEEQIKKLLSEKEIIYHNLSDQNTALLAKETAITKLLYAKTELNEDLERRNEELATQDEEIRQNNEQLAQTNEQLVAERERFLLSQAELEDRNLELDQILYRTSHDIRSPMTSVLGLLNLMKEEKNEVKMNEYIAFAERRILDLDRFTQTMLDYGKGERRELIREKIDFQEIIKNVWLALQYLPKYEQLNKKLNIIQYAPHFYSDSLKMSIVFSNILSNAIKYQYPNREDSFVGIEINQYQDYAQIVIEDNGIGMATEYVGKVFEMFFRGTTNNEGSGLGMYIVKQTIERLQGEISFKSVLGKGSKIEIKLKNLLP